VAIISRRTHIDGLCILGESTPRESEGREFETLKAQAAEVACDCQSIGYMFEQIMNFG
jgi:hypothetical protein